MRKYEKRDRDILDYGYEVLDGCSFAVRGPIRVNANGPLQKSVVCLGSAATFGRHVSRPYPLLLAERIHHSVTNLGFGGARPETYLREATIIDLCRRADLIVMEIMSSRSCASEIFTPFTHLTRWGCVAEEYLTRMAKSDVRRFRGRQVAVDRIYEWASENLSWEELQRIRQQVLDVYRRDACALIEAINKPVILLWFSRRPMDAKSMPGSYSSWNCGFPHFVDHATVNDLQKLATGLVDITCATHDPGKCSDERTPRSNMEQPVVAKWKYEYYPSPEMHDDVARRLADFISAIWSRKHR